MKAMKFNIALKLHRISKNFSNNFKKYQTSKKKQAFFKKWRFFLKKKDSEAFKNLRGIVVFKIARDVNSHPGGRRATLKQNML